MVEDSDKFNLHLVDGTLGFSELHLRFIRK